MKHLAKYLCAALILVLAAATAVAEVKLDTVFQYRTLIQQVQGTGCLIVESKQDNLRGLFTTAGAEIIPCAYKSIDSLSYGFFSAYNDKEAVDGRALWTVGGHMIGKAEYGGFKVFNSRWVAAFVVNPEEVPDAEKDIKIGSKTYQYERVDLYFVPDGADESLAPIASLGRDAYADASVHGEYIAVTNREKAVSVYDSSFQPVSVTLSAANKPLYTVNKSYQLISLLTNSILDDGYTEAAEVNLSDRMLIKATRVALDGTKLACLMTADGTVLLPPEYEIIDITDHYAVVADQEKQQGLFSLDEARFIVPCGYSAIVPCATDLDKYVHNGYVCVEKEEKLGFYDVVNGVESCAPKYSKRAVTIIGCSLAFTTVEGDLTIVAADGAVNILDADEVLVTRGNGSLLEVKKGASFGLIDWHGNIVVPVNHYKDIVVTDDSQAIIRTSTGLQLDTVTR